MGDMGRDKSASARCLLTEQSGQLSELVTLSHLEQLRDMIGIIQEAGRTELAQSLRQWCELLEEAIDARPALERAESWWG